MGTVGYCPEMEVTLFYEVYDELIQIVFTYYYTIRTC